MGEVLPLCDAIRFLERESPRALRPRHWNARRRPLWLSGLKLRIDREPWGLVLIIAPGNYPLLLPGTQAAHALAAGNAVLLKPAPGHAALASLLRDLALSAGLDPDLFVLLPEETKSVAEAVAIGVDQLLLTGSAQTGARVLEMLAPHGVPSVMELSGCDSVFLLAGADLDLLTTALAFGLRFNGGASCVAPRRLFVPHPLLAEVERRLREAALHLGPFAVPAETDRRSRAWMAEAIEGGARVVLDCESQGTTWKRPLILSDVRPTMRIVREDVFAPLLSLIPVADEREALTADGMCAYALGATVFGPRRQAEAFAKQVGAGAVIVNDVLAPHPIRACRWRLKGEVASV